MFDEQKLKELEQEKNADRIAAEKAHGEVWDTTQLQKDFTVHSFMAPYVVVTRKSDNVKGSLEFTHMPRFYFNFQPK